MDYDRVTQAQQFAITAHVGQKYGENPYMFHLSGVAKLAGGRDTFPELRSTILACCYLHDTIEDTATTYRDIEKVFGVCIAEVVQCVTKVAGETYPDYMNKVLGSVLATEVKKCDTMFNLASSFREGNLKRIAKYIKQMDILERGYV